MDTISLLDRSSGAGVSRIARERLLEALRSRNVAVKTDAGPGDPIRLSLVIGLASDDLVSELLATQQVACGDGRECTVCWHCGQHRVLAGSDESGLGYILNDAADVVTEEGVAGLERMPDRVERPETEVRGLDRFIMGPLDDEWFLSDDFWEYYLDRLSRYRFNRFVLVTGFDTAYMSPPYPFFVDAPGYSSVRVTGLAEGRRERNLRQLSTISRMCHERGLEFVFATWQQTPWTRAQEALVDGLPDGEGELAQYCAAGLRALLSGCPELDGLHFRVNLEAGIGDRNTNEAFWRECLRAVAHAAPGMAVDLRAKGLTDGMIDYARELGLRARVPTKYWCEHAGLPYHLTQMREEELTQLHDLNHSRRYSYSDLLRKPRRADLIYRLWNQGSCTLFSWGDADYARRFVHSCRLGSAAGYEITAPLSMRGGHALSHRHPWQVLRQEDHRVARWEDDRYWPWYLVFGRMGFSTATGDGVWHRELRAHFGADGPIVGRLLQAASRILPLITASHMPKHPMLQYWPEMSTGGALFAQNNHEKAFGTVTFGSAEPSDPGLFYRITDYVDDEIRGHREPKYTPLQVARCLNHLANGIDQGLDSLARESTEVPVLITDCLMLRDLARCHSAKICAALNLARYASTEDRSRLLACYSSAVSAREAWRSLAERGAANYSPHLDFGAGGSTARRGSWGDRLVELDADLRCLEEQLEIRGGAPKTPSDVAPGEAGDLVPPAFSCTPPACSAPRVDLAITLRVALTCRVSRLCMHYRHTDQTEGAFHRTPLEPGPEGFECVVPAAYVDPEWDLLIYFSALGSDGEPVLYPGICHSQHPLPYFSIEVES